MGPYKKRQIFAVTAFLLLLSCSVNITSADNNDILTEVVSNYKLVPDEGTVEVSREITFHNKDTDTKYWRGYYSNYNAYLPEGAMKIKVSDKDEPMAFIRSPEGYYVFYFNHKVWYDESYTFTIDYELETNRNTAVFSLSEHGDNVEVTLEVPSDFETHLSRDDYKIEEKKYSSVYIFEKGKRWDRSCIVNSVRDSPRLVLTETAHLSERDVEVRINYWEGEEEWAYDTMRTTIESLSLLEEKWGIAYPQNYNITITQANITETGGYGGYNQGSNGIWLLYTSSNGILIHELAHYWTRACNFDQLWMDEGYADLYAYMVLSEMEPDEAEVRRNTFLSKYRTLKDEYDYPLSDWNTPEKINGSTEEHVDYGYKKAFSMALTLYNTIGVDALKDANLKFVNSETAIGNSEYIDVIDSVSTQDISFVEDYLYA